MARKSKEVPEINAGSMADIAFLLLIFFLVTTTMDQDSGISRKLPAKQDEEPIDPPPVHDRNIFIVLLNQKNQLLVEEKPMDIDDLKDATIEFITNNGKNSTLSDEPGKAIVSLRNHRLTSYDTYVAVQDQLTAAYNQIRNGISNQRFGKPFEDLSKDQAKEIRKDYPMNISEAEPIKN